MGRRARQKRSVIEEFAGLDLEHGRRTARGKRFAARLALAPDASLPVAMKTEADLEGAYRHLSSEDVDVGDILLPHIVATAKRVRQEGSAYVLHDTTGFVFGGEMAREGLARVNSKKDQGFRAHVSLAVSMDRITPLGVLALGTSSRADPERPASETIRWQRGMEISSAHVGDPSMVIHVADRESDMYELLVESQRQDLRFIFRAAQNRATLQEESVAPLFEVVAGARSMFEIEVPLSARSTKNRPPHQKKAFPARGSRQAKLSFSAMQVTIRRPKNARASLPESIFVNAVRVWEPQPPEGETAVEWVLLTSEPIDSKPKVRAIVDGYRTRWTVEIFFNALKSGCAFERRQLESAHSLINLLGYCVVIAYAILVYRAQGRDSKLPATAVLTDQQLRCLDLMTEGKLEKNPTAEQALQRIAALGGHLKRNGSPGWRTLSRGFQKLLEFEQAYLLITAKGLAPRPRAPSR